MIMGSIRRRREEVVFVMVGLVRGSREEQTSLAAWVEGREIKSREEAEVWEKREPKKERRKTRNKEARRGRKEKGKGEA